MALFGAMTTIRFVGMTTIDRPERMSTIAYSRCGGELTALSKLSYGQFRWII
jgi:hypothetical protein